MRRNKGGRAAHLEQGLDLTQISSSTGLHQGDFRCHTHFVDVPASIWKIRLLIPGAGRISGKLKRLTEVVECVEYDVKLFEPLYIVVRFFDVSVNGIDLDVRIECSRSMCSNLTRRV